MVSYRKLLKYRFENFDNRAKAYGPKLWTCGQTEKSIWQPGKRDYEFRKKYPESKLDLMRTQPMRTLWGIMRELEHTDRIIDVVKIDREGPRKAYEPAVIRNLLEDGTYRYVIWICKNWQPMIIELSCIRQLVFELHFFGPMTDPDEIRSLFSMLKGIIDLLSNRAHRKGPRSKIEQSRMDFSIIFRSRKRRLETFPISTIKDKDKTGIRRWFFDPPKWEKHIHVRFVMA